MSQVREVLLLRVGTKKGRAPMSALPTESSEVFGSPTRQGLSTCHAVCHPFGDLLFVPDDRAGTQLDLLREGSVPHAVIDEGLAHARHLKHLCKTQKTGLSSID